MFAALTLFCSRTHLGRSRKTARMYNDINNAVDVRRVRV